MMKVKNAGISIRKMTEKEKAYIAGLIDGEGSIFISKTNERGGGYVLWVTMNNTHEGVVKFLKEKCGGSTCSFRNKLNNSKLFRWSINHKGGTNFIKQIYPYLIIKKEVADLAFEFQKSMGKCGVKLSKEKIKIRKDIWGKMKLAHDSYKQFYVD